MSEQVPSDHLFPRLRKRVSEARAANSTVALHPDQVIALIHAAELLQEMQHLGTHYLSEQWFAHRDKLLAKLEAL